VRCLIIGISWALWAIGGSAAATVTTVSILGSAPPERAGSVSALAQTGAELGGALGIAAAIYLRDPKAPELVEAHCAAGA
jgi:hypothetical protein